MLFVWSGKGLFVPLLGLGLPALTQLAVNELFRDWNYFGKHAWPKLVGFGLGAIAVFLLARWLDSRPRQPTIDSATGEEVVLRCEHHFFFVSMRTWSYVLLALGIAIMIASLI